MSLRDNYLGMWQKSAYLENLVKKEIERRYPALRVEMGKGAGSPFEHDPPIQTPVGAPDLYVYYGRKLICEIEVTGSDKIVPKEAWIAHHKVSYAKKLDDPDSYGIILFYGKNHQIRYFATAATIFKLSKGAEIREIRGYKESYHVIPTAYLKSETGFWVWFQWRLEKIL